MNKRELIEHINNTLFDNLKDTFFTEPTFSITESAKDNKVAITFETEQVGVLVGGMLKKFEKVTIPQFAADFIAEQKKLSHTLSYSIDASMSDRVAEWYWDNSELFARAWLDGYEIEQEKRYLVKMNGVKDIMGFLNFGGITKLWFMGDEKNLYGCRTHHTRKELEDAGFREVFNSPLFEVEEVTE